MTSYKNNLVMLKEDFLTNFQVLIIGNRESEISKLLEMIILKLNAFTTTKNTNIYTKSIVKYSVPSTVVHNSQFNSSTIEQILASQLDLPDELYCNSWKNTDTCINIFDNCFSKIEFDNYYKKQFTKLFKYSKNNKIINVIVCKNIYDTFYGDFYNNFNYVFYVDDII